MSNLAYLNTTPRYPAPLTPEDSSLRKLDFLPLEVCSLLESDFLALSTGEEFKAALTLWAKSWMQRPAASLPEDGRILARWVCMSLREFEASREIILRGWVKCSDGRLYHPVLAARANIAWATRQKARASVNARWAKERAEREAEETWLFGDMAPDAPEPERDADGRNNDVEKIDAADNIPENRDLYGRIYDRNTRRSINNNKFPSRREGARERSVENVNNGDYFDDGLPFGLPSGSPGGSLRGSLPGIAREGPEVVAGRGAFQGKNCAKQAKNCAKQAKNCVIKPDKTPNPPDQPCCRCASGGRRGRGTARQQDHQGLLRELMTLTGRAESGCRGLLQEMLNNLGGDVAGLQAIFHRARKKNLLSPVAWLLMAVWNESKERKNDDTNRKNVT